ncbi:MAG: hypothetical protein RLZZ245_97 [Verrucomicrobiota bacterium]
MNGRAALSLFCLAPREVCRAVRLPGFAVGSYSTISPLPVSLRTIGGIFLLHCLSEFLAVPVPHFHEARCPVVSGLSSPPLARNCDRPGSGASKVRALATDSKQKLRISRICAIGGGFPIPGSAARATGRLNQLPEFAIECITRDQLIRRQVFPITPVVRHDRGHVDSFKFWLRVAQGLIHGQ